MLRSFAHLACSPFLQAFLYEEEVCKAALTCHISLDVLYLFQDSAENGSLGFLSVVHSSTVAVYF